MPVLGMFGNAMRSAQRRPLTPEEEAAMQQPRPRGSMGGMASGMASARPLFGGQMMQQSLMAQMPPELAGEQPPGGSMAPTEDPSLAPAPGPIA